MSSEQDINLYELLNLSIRPPQRSGVDFVKLHDLLKAVLSQLEQLEESTRCSGEQQNQDETSEVEQSVSSSTQTTSSDAGADGPWELQGGAGTREDEAPTVQTAAEPTQLSQELTEHKEELREEMKELRDQLRATAEACSAMESCCHRVDILEDILRTLKDACQRSPPVRELFKTVTWNLLQPGPQPGPLPGSVPDSLPGPLPEIDGPQMELDLKDLFTLDTPAPSSSSEPQQQCSSEAAEAMSTVNNLMVKFSKLETVVAGLNTGKVDKSQLTHLRELINGKGSLEATQLLTDQLNEQKALIETLMSDREKFEALEEMIMNSASSEPTSEGVDTDSKVFRELKQQLSYVRKSVQRLEQDMKLMKVTQADGSKKYDHLNDQLNVLQDHYEDLLLSSTMVLDYGPENQQTATRAGTQQEEGAEQNAELVNSLQRAVLQLQADSEKLQEVMRFLHEDNLQKQNYIEALGKTTEELEEKKADKLMIEKTLKTDRSSLDSKVSRVQFDSVTEELNALFSELLDKVTGQEKDWHNVISKLSTEMECKLSRIEFEPVKIALEDRWSKVIEKLQNMEVPAADDAAASRKQLLDTFHCLCCDRPISSNLLAPSLMELPFDTNPTPQFTVTTQEKIQPINRGKPKVRDYSYLAMVRGCSSQGTIITRTMMFRNLKKMRDARARAWNNPPVQLEQDETVKYCSYQGYLNEPARGNPKTKSPAAPTKEEKARCSPYLQPSASLETSHGSPLHHTHSGQVSRSGISEPPSP